MSDAPNAAGVPGRDDPDNEVLSELQALAAALDPVPSDAIAAARSAIAWRTIDAELAQLSHDVSSDPDHAGVRSSDAATLLTFEAPMLTVEIEVVDTGAGRRLLGQLIPPGQGEVEVRHRGGETNVAADDVGRFRVEDVAAGPVRLRCVVGDSVVETDWFLA